MTTCSICLEEPAASATIITADCKHVVCSICINDMTSATCPICRKDYVPNATGITQAILDRIDRNGVAYRHELATQEYETILGELLHARRRNNVHSIHFEVQLGLEYLERCGLPTRLLPHDILISIQDSSSPRPPGSVFVHIVTQGMAYFGHLCDYEGGDNDSSEGSEEDISSDGEPYTAFNVNLHRSDEPDDADDV